MKQILTYYFQQLDNLLEKEDNIKFPSLEKNDSDSHKIFSEEDNKLCNKKFDNSPENKIKNIKLINALLDFIYGRK